jgi:hypothetical protein
LSPIVAVAFGKRTSKFPTIANGRSYREPFDRATRPTDHPPSTSPGCGRPSAGDFFGFFGALKRGDFFWVDAKKARSASSADAKEPDFFGAHPKKRQNGSRRPHCQFVSETLSRNAVDFSRMLQPLLFHPGVTGRSGSKIRLKAVV